MEPIEMAGELKKKLGRIGCELAAREAIAEVAGGSFSHAAPARQWVRLHAADAADCYDRVVQLRNVAAHAGGRRAGRRGRRQPAAAAAVAVSSEEAHSDVQESVLTDTLATEPEEVPQQSTSTRQELRGQVRAMIKSVRELLRAMNDQQELIVGPFSQSARAFMKAAGDLLKGGGESVT